MRAVAVILFLVLVGACRNQVPKEPVKEILPGKPEANLVLEKPPKLLEEGTFHLEEEAFGKIVELTGKCKSVKEIFRVTESEMLVKDDLLILKNRIDPNMFMLYKLPELKLIRSFGKMGQGPGEFTYPSLVSSEERDRLFYIFEGTKGRIYYLDHENKIGELPFKLPDFLSGETQAHFLNDHELVYAAGIPKGKAIFYANYSGGQVAHKQVYELSFSKKHRNWGAYLGCFAASKKRNRLVYVYKYFKRLVFLNLAANMVRIVEFAGAGPKAGDVVSMMSPEHVTHYWTLSAGEKYLYLSYSGRTPLQVMKEIKNSNGYIFIEQFDWNGNPIRKFRLDHWGRFCVDEKNSKLYLLSITEDDPFVVYDLPKI
ncbi:MAG: TolB-like 6-bladed beta-propeller domain-containing protein [Acidobacteria bacterium]|nr:TolB-like 6-bladed beta-propeller domain-containing protein [Acidobacteriota bacterium]MBU4403995.1 TolB-like 6-bladed beta-propeller domain-containing protein [Acidobacteriota bacterium]MCG2811907.1 TolB-like 6-bladed beta-propeller domain-containing protein [Candidatus Aminicenantes bacterium]